MNPTDVVQLMGLCTDIEESEPRHNATEDGRVIPRDFSSLSRLVPPGVIAGSIILSRPHLPVRSLQEFVDSADTDASSRIASMKDSLLFRAQSIPLPFFPAPGGMVPWGRTTRDGVLLWDTTAPDSADWTTVLTDSDFQVWVDLPLTTSPLIWTVLSGGSGSTPAFETFEDFEQGTFWEVYEKTRETAFTLADQEIGSTAEVLERVRSIGVPGLHGYADKQFKFATGDCVAEFPEDYTAIMKEFAGGVIAGVHVFPPSRSLATRTNDLGGGMSEMLKALGKDTSFMQWGEVDGRAMGWLTTHEDPTGWCVAYLKADGSALTCLEDQTFATFLQRRLRGNNSLF
ncbi:hypothetical protein [Streptomyces candidus]|uniref:Uncharacterized protein n=1 Tax=Streptomyces candidus TaxID=67283 RepID=A0A7X0HM16_9ACTN|nr:hypothetical protein [Streptomyces candidus]MBB6440170.1 hypothetical protein [Streptomyces candidus]GHH56019.1 hypothetical protein GCM10018773_61280 [Streptomyces candidus]